MSGSATSNSPAADPPDFAPVEIVEVEISEELPRLVPGTAENGHRYGSALCLIRLHSQPLGMIEVDLPTSGLGPAALAKRIEHELSAAIDAHVRDDDLAREALGAAGIAGPDLPRCRRARQ